MVTCNELSRVDSACIEPGVTVESRGVSSGTFMATQPPTIITATRGPERQDDLIAANGGERWATPM